MSWICPRCGTELAGNADLRRLTARERQTLQQLVNGRTPHKIAADWGVSYHTVRTHINSLYAKLQVSSQVEAVSYAIRHGMTPQEPGGTQ